LNTMRASDVGDLLRVGQWYKNLVVFLALFFTNNVFNAPLLGKSILAFLSLCLVSSSYYILNDIRDRKTDMKHPEKRDRALASGRVSVGAGYLLGGILLVASVILAYQLSPSFILFVIALFVSSSAYNLWLRDVAFVDLHVIAINFLMRAVAGSVAIDVPSSPWLITTVFFTALLLGLSKRRAELTLLEGDAIKFKGVYAVYTKQLLDVCIAVTATTLLIAYILYTFFVHQGGYLMVTIPFASFVIFRYIHLGQVNHVAARKTSRLFFDRQIAIALILWAAVTFYILYMVRV